MVFVKQINFLIICIFKSGPLFFIVFILITIYYLLLCSNYM